MRFLLSNSAILDLTFQVLLAACRLGNHSVSDRSKMESLLELLAVKFFKLDHATNLRKSKALVGASDQEVVLILKGSQAYYEAKKTGYSYPKQEEITSQSETVEVPAQKSESGSEITIQPEQPSVLVPAFKEGYSLLFGSPQFFILLKNIATIYERLAKAEQLIAATARSQMAKHGCSQPEIPEERFRLFVSGLLASLT